jgi:ATP-binding cassette subfamily B protein
MLREKPFADLTGHIASIHFKNIFFKYPNTDRFVLKDINLEVQKGQVIALVGENGSGKTTLIKLLCRLYDASEGDILINNTHIKQLDIAEWRHRVSVIFQDFKEYHFTVKDNIRINELGMDADMPRIENAATMTSADKFITQMPNSYETMLGKEFRNGTELSGGQWQKIALSRAFYKDAEVIILDEPTSAIDPLAEYEIFMQLRGMAKDKILILITHRLYNLKMADCIFVMNNGEIIEQGHHEKLMAIKGKYYQMFEKQV